MPFINANSLYNVSEIIKKKELKSNVFRALSVLHLYIRLTAFSNKLVWKQKHSYIFVWDTNEYT